MFVAIVAAAYLPALRAGFIWDDDVHVVSNPRMLSWGGLIEIWTSRWAVYYPLTSTTFWILRRVAGLNPFVYHAFTLALHVASALLFAKVLRLLRAPGARLGALLFALHPVAVESVAWVTELKNTQSLLLMVWCVERLHASGCLDAFRVRNRRAYGAALLLFLLALLSKPSVVMLPPALLVLLWWRGGWPAVFMARWSAPLFAAALLMAGWTIWEQRWNSGASGFEWAAPFADRLVTAGRLITFYFQKLVWPEPLMFIYPSLQLSAAEPRAWLPLIAVAAAFGCIGLNARDWGRPALAVGAIYVLFLFPILGFFNVYFMRYSQAADHFQYLALLAPCAFGGALLARLAGRQRLGPAVQVAAVLLVSVYAGLTWRHARVFESNERLWRHTVEQNPRAWMAQNNLGLLYFDRGLYAEAESHFRAAIAANPRHYEALCNLGAVALRRGRLAEARAAQEEAVRWQPRLPQAWYNLGRVHERMGDREAAREAHHRALALHPEFAEAHARLALLSEEDGDFDRALRHHLRALRAATSDAREHARFLNARAARYISMQQWPAARAFIEASLQVAPDFEETRQLKAAWQQLLRLPSGDPGS
jgi:tetratricopeptide (TPR) repeat protein